MKKYWLLFVLLLLLSGSSGLYADVILTDEQAEELDQTLDELETTLKAQNEEIANLKMQNEQLQNDSESKQKQLNEQDETIKEAKSSYKKRNIFSILLNILISIGAGLLGFATGVLLF